MSKEKKEKAKGKAKQPGLTQKQALIKVGTLLRGIDNSSTMIEKHQAVIDGNVKQLGGILSGLSNQESQRGTVQPKEKAKERAKPTAEKVKAVKAAQSKTKSKPSKGSNGADPKAAVKGRLTIKDAVLGFINQDGPDTKASLYHKAINKYGYWSRQSFYQAMKDKKSFKTVDGKIHAVPAPAEAKTSDADAKKFVEKVEADQSVAAMA